MEVELNFTNGAMTVFGDEKLGDIGGFEVIFVLTIIIWAMKEHDKVSVLLDGARLTKIGENRARIVAASNATRKLSKCNNGNF